MEQEGLFGFWRQDMSGSSHTLVVTDEPRYFNGLLITLAAAEPGKHVPFTDNDDETTAVKYISRLKPRISNRIGHKLVQKDEIVQAKKLLEDKTGFLAEDLYWTDTYTLEYDR